MKFNRTVFLLLGILLLGGVIAYQHKTIKRIKIERNTYQNNTHTLLSEIEVLKKDSAGKVCQIQTMKLDIEELKKYRQKDIATIKDLKIKLRHIQAVSKQNMEVSAPIKAGVKDSIFVTDTIIRYIPVIKYHDPHITFEGKIINDSLTARVNIPITLTQILHKVPKRKFLWWSWGCKAVKQVIVTDNPYVNIKYAEYIELSK